MLALVGCTGKPEKADRPGRRPGAEAPTSPTSPPGTTDIKAHQAATLGDEGTKRALELLDELERLAKRVQKEDTLAGAIGDNQSQALGTAPGT